MSVFIHISTSFHYHKIINHSSVSFSLLLAPLYYYFNMAGFLQLYQYFSFKLALLILSTVLKAPGIFIMAEDQNGWIAECKDEAVKSWHPWWYLLSHASNGTKCCVQCPLNCRCSLGNFSEVLINCSNGNMLVALTSYPSNVKHLSWAHNNLYNISKESFYSVADTLEALHLNSNNLQHLQPGVLDSLIKLMYLNLSQNLLKEIEVEMFRGLANLTWLDLSCNELTLIQPGVFGRIQKLQWLILENNKLKEIQPGVFKGLGNLSQLYLDSNMLKEIRPGVFKGLGNLTSLSLTSNMLREIEPGVLSGMRRLEQLSVNANMLTKLLPSVLGELGNLVVLYLSDNPLASLHPDTFKSLSKLDVLRLSNISLTFLPEDIFKNLHQLRYVELSKNNLNKLGFQLFQKCSFLETVDLTQNPLQWIKIDDFSGLNLTTQILVDNYASCCFVSSSICHSKSPRSRFLTCRRLLPYNVLRVLIWVVSIFAIVNNVIGGVVKCKQRKHINKIQFLLITNLSISDLLMGVYLIILLSADLYYTEYFPSHSDSWRSSILCKIAGSLSVLSSEASVFFITLISIDRFLRVKFPYGRHQLNHKSAAVVLSLLWLLAFSISITSFVLSGINSDAYAVSEICVGLPISRQLDYNTSKTSIQLSKSFENFGYNTASILQNTRTSSQVGMYFSIAIFAVLNLGCFLVVVFCYTTIFITVWFSTKKSGLSISRNEIRMAKKVFLLVLTDCCCWVPIGVLSILVQAGTVEVSPVAYAWIATFILPINSSINPFLYTLGDVIADMVTCSCKLTRRNTQDTCDYIEAKEVARQK